MNVHWRKHQPGPNLESLVCQDGANLRFHRLFHLRPHLPALVPDVLGLSGDGPRPRIGSAVRRQLRL